MEFIASGESLNMIADPAITWDIDRLDEEDFRCLSRGAESYVGHEDIASLLNVPINRKPVILRAGDTLYVANMFKGNLTFFVIRVREAEHPIQKEMIMEEA